MKLSANHIDADADVGFALDAGVDCIILDGRGTLIITGGLRVPVDYERMAKLSGVNYSGFSATGAFA